MSIVPNDFRCDGRKTILPKFAVNFRILNETFQEAFELLSASAHYNHREMAWQEKGEIDDQ